MAKVLDTDEGVAVFFSLSLTGGWAIVRRHEFEFRLHATKRPICVQYGRDLLYKFATSET